MRLSIRVSPGARQSALVGRHGDAWKVRVAAAPERGKANAELCRYLAQLLDVPRGSVTVVAGAAGRDKVVEVTGLTEALATELLEKHIAAG